LKKEEWKGDLEGWGGFSYLGSPSFKKRGLGEIFPKIKIPLTSPFEKGRNYFESPSIPLWKRGRAKGVYERWKNWRKNLKKGTNRA